MKLFQTILVTLALSFANGYKVFRDDVVTGEPWLQYTRSGLINKVLSKRSQEQHVALMQRVQNNKVQQLRAAIADLLKKTSTTKQVPGRKSKQKSPNK